MTFHVTQRHVRQARLIEGLPEILVENRFASSRFPSLALPAGHPGTEAINQIFAVSAQHQIGVTRKLRQSLQHRQGRLELHAVIGRGRVGTAELLHTAVLEANQGAPASGTGVAAACSVGGGSHHTTSAIGLSH